MKKILIMFVAFMFIMPIVSAANLNVKTLKATKSDNVASYSGTTDSGVIAVSCSLFKGNDEIDIASVSVSDNKFNGTFGIADGDYVIKCANYDGGDIVSTDVVLASVNNPQTGDNVVKFLMIGAISVVGIVGLGIYIKKIA